MLFFLRQLQKVLSVWQTGVRFARVRKQPQGWQPGRLLGLQSPGRQIRTETCCFLRFTRYRDEAWSFNDFQHLSVGVWKKIDCWWLCMSLNCFLLVPPSPPPPHPSPPPPFAPSHTIIFPAKLNKLKCVYYILGWRKWCKCLSFSLLTYLLILPVDWLHCTFLHDFQMTAMMITAHKVPWSIMASSSFPPRPKSPQLCPAKRSGLLLRTLSRSPVLTSSRSLVLTRSKSQVWTGSWSTLSQAVLMSVIFSHWKFRFPVQLPPQRPRSSEGQQCRWPVLWTTCSPLPKSHVRYRCVKLDQKNLFE